MTASQTPALPLRTSEDIVRMRQYVREQSLAVGVGHVDQTKIVTAASELARNTLIYGGGGELTVQPLVDGARRGLKLVFSDRGPGIPDIAQALKDGFSTGGGLGLGLGGAKRLSNEFNIDTQPGAGTRVTIVRWK
jgi:serine/threonine-protein kinase RsbT